MRPIRLEVEGFTCYRDRQEPLEFAGLSLFAIAGPTGAGKSSILDTMLYALYGEIPRIGKQGIGEVISQGRDVLSVCLDFSVQGATYRVARRVKRGKKGALTTTVTLAEITDGSERNIADQVRPVNEAVVKLLGLDYSAFTQTVVLPQGEFARFLKADPKGQRAILQHLLRHDVFERMRAEAEKRRSRVEAELGGLERLVNEHEGQTEEALAALGLELAAAHRHLEQTAEERSALDRQVQENRRLRQLTEDCSRLKNERGILDAEEPTIAGARMELELARKASAIAPRLDAFNAAAARLKHAQGEREKAFTTASGLSTRQVAAEQEVASAKEAAQQCGPLNERIRSIDEIKGDLERRRTLSNRLERLAKSLPATERHATEATRLLDAAAKAADDARYSTDTQKTAVAAIAYDQQLHALVDEVWTRVVQLRTISDEVTRLEQDHQTLEAECTKATHNESVMRQASEQTSIAVDADVQAANGAEVALSAAQNRHQAAALRAHLHAGDECPVCLQQIASVPTVEDPPELARLITLRDAADARVEKSRRASQLAGRKLAAAEADLNAAARARESSAAKLRQRVETQSQLQTAIVTALEPISPAHDPTEALSWIETKRTELGQAKQALSLAEELLRRAEAATQKTALALVTAESESRRATERHVQAVHDHDLCAVELEALSTHILSVSTHADPSIERGELAQRVEALQAREQTARTALGHLQQAAASAEAALVAATGAAKTAESDMDAARLALDDALRSAGFTTADDAKAATRTERQQSELDAAIRKHDDARVVVARRLLEVEPQILGKQVDAEALAHIETRFAEATDAWRDADRTLSRLQGEQARLAAAVAKRVQLIAERDVLRGTHSVTSEMALDLKGDAFQEYLLEEAFRALVTSASVRMREISNRYTLEWDAGDFYVVDHDNAGERRRAETLSGGETFMASLCLALQLSDEVLRTSGALQMDSLFIDEGFGTLDSDSLGEVTDAMEALRQEGGRLIGVISHRPELTDRLPGCIRIEKGAGESRWSLERIG